jgi:cysteinyl-tRNA synthetase
VFPHHENEIAQSEGATGQPFSRFWIHTEHLLVDDQKMSKSLGNVYTLSDITERGFRVSALRYLLLSSHYRKQLNFTWVGMQQAEEALRRLTDCLDRMDTVTNAEAHPEMVRSATTSRAAFDEALSDDLNTAAGLAAMFDLVRTVNTAIDHKQIGVPDLTTVRAAFAHFDDVLGVISLRRTEDAEPPIPEAEIQAAIEARQAARRARNFAEADRIRDDMAARGVLFEDSPLGTRWKRK